MAKPSIAALWMIRSNDVNDFIGSEERSVLQWCDAVDDGVWFEAATSVGEDVPPLVVDRLA